LFLSSILEDRSFLKERTRCLVDFESVGIRERKKKVQMMAIDQNETWDMFGVGLILKGDNGSPSNG